MLNTAAANKSITFRIAACVLCLVIVAVALDSLPDPPAVKPHGRGIALVSLPHQHLSAEVKNNVVDCVSRVPHFQASLFSLGEIFESRRPFFRLEFVQRAIDISPPDLS
jgi:hypothetical protein